MTCYRLFLNPEIMKLQQVRPDLILPAREGRNRAAGWRERFAFQSSFRGGAGQAGAACQAGAVLP